MPRLIEGNQQPSASVPRRGSVIRRELPIATETTQRQNHGSPPAVAGCSACYKARLIPGPSAHRGRRGKDLFYSDPNYPSTHSPKRLPRAPNPRLIEGNKQPPASLPWRGSVIRRELPIATNATQRQNHGSPPAVAGCVRFRPNVRLASLPLSAAYPDSQTRHSKAALATIRALRDVGRSQNKTDANHLEGDLQWEAKKKNHHPLWKSIWPTGAE